MGHEIERIETQLRLSFEGPAWHGPSVLEALEGVSAEDAAEHPIEGAHSIWELVLHLIGTYRLVLRRLRVTEADNGRRGLADCFCTGASEVAGHGPRLARAERGTAARGSSLRYRASG